MRRVRGWLAAIGVMVALTACGSPAPSPEVIVGPSAQPAAQECREIDLLTESGLPLDLTGTWQGNDAGVYDLNQDRSCLYWLGMSNYRGSEPGEYWTNVFYGTIQSDFTIAGHWGDVPYTPGADMDNGEITLGVDFDSSNGEEFPILRRLEATGGFGASAFVPVDALPAAVDLEGSFGGNYDHLLQTGCLWVQTGGQRYELIGDGGWSIRGDPPIRVEDERGQVFAREGDTLRIHGQVMAGLGTGCVESAIWVEVLEPVQGLESPQ
jgi:hypothetical protein